MNIEIIAVDTNLAKCRDGVLVADDGTVQALWLTFLGGLPSRQDPKEYHGGLAARTLLPVVSRIRKGIIPKPQTLSAEFQPITMLDARIMGVPDWWIQKAELANPSNRRVFMVKRIFQLGNDGDLLEGDILLTLGKKLVTKFSDLDVTGSSGNPGAVIIRRHKELKLKLTTMTACETERVILFSGAIIQQPHHGVRQHVREIFSEVYVACRTYGSPAERYDLGPGNFITHVNGRPTSDLGQFLRAVIEIPDNEGEGRPYHLLHIH